MTEMRRITVAVPDEIDNAVIALRKTDEFARCTYSEIVRKILERGIAVMEHSAKHPEHGRDTA